MSLKTSASSTKGIASSPQPLRMSRIPRSPGLHERSSPMTAASTRLGESGHAPGAVTSKPPTPTLLIDNVAKPRLPALAGPKPRQPQTTHPFIAAHLGVPCTLGALDHLLTCGHKVMIEQPENCSSNCNQPPNSSYINPRSLDEPFICMACITRQIKREYDEKVSSFHSTLGPVARVTGKTEPEQWIAAKVDFVGEVWRELDFEKMKFLAAAGRFCYPFYVDEEYESWVRVIVSELCVQSPVCVQPPVCESPCATPGSPTNTKATDETSQRISIRIPRMSSSPVAAPRAPSKEPQLLGRLEGA